MEIVAIIGKDEGCLCFQVFAFQQEDDRSARKLQWECQNEGEIVPKLDP